MRQQPDAVGAYPHALFPPQVQSGTAHEDDSMLQLQVKPVYSVPDFVRDFGLSRTAVYQEIKTGRLRVFKIGTATRIAGEDALAWRESYRTIKAA
jgi:hypothetical protein